MRRFAAAALAVLAVLALPLRPLAHESPIDHVDRAVWIWIEDGSIRLSYQIQLSERAALMQTGAMDSNADGAVAKEERDAFFAAFAGQLAKQLAIEIGAQKLALAPLGAVDLRPEFRQVFTFSAPLAPLSKGRHSGRLVDDYARNYPGVYRWSGPKVPIVDGASVIAIEPPKSKNAADHPSVLEVRFEIVQP